MENITCVNKTECTGCAACCNICPVSAIEMSENSEGFLEPTINSETCIHCGLCAQSCPVINEKSGGNELIGVYAAAAEDSVRMESSSGGIFTLLAEKTLKKGGYVCGAAFTDDFQSVRHILIHTSSELSRLRGSKYVQSEMGDCYRQIKGLLEKGVEVLFSGCPCQVAGLDGYLNKKYDNLLTVDILCHGVPSPKAFRKFISSVVLSGTNRGKKILEFSFRNKWAHGWAHSIFAKIEGGSGVQCDKNTDILV